MHESIPVDPGDRDYFSRAPPTQRIMEQTEFGDFGAGDDRPADEAEAVAGDGTGGGSATVVDADRPGRSTGIADRSVEVGPVRED